jgi:hypothetical protein
MDDETKSATSLHESRRGDSEGSDSENEGAKEETAVPTSKFGLVIDDSRLEKTIQMILDRLGALEVIYICIFFICYSCRSRLDSSLILNIDWFIGLHIK